jgi:hypothetical protein
MSGSHSAHQTVLQMCDAIDQQFVHEVGPFGQVVAEQTRARWLASGNKINATHAFEYLQMLSKQIPGRDKREAFLDKAMRFVKP